MYLGASPFDAPGTYSLLQWTETVEGIWYPRGGFHQVREGRVYGFFYISDGSSLTRSAPPRRSFNP